MELQDILDRATITFPTPLRLKHAEELLRYVADKLPGIVNYKVEQYKNWIPNEEMNKSIMDRGTLEIKGSVHNLKHPLEFDSMNLEHWEKDSRYVSSMKFQVIDDDEIMYQRVFPLWDNVRKVVEGYFREKGF